MRNIGTIVGCVLCCWMWSCCKELCDLWQLQHVVRTRHCWNNFATPFGRFSPRSAAKVWIGRSVERVKCTLMCQVYQKATSNKANNNWRNQGCYFCFPQAVQGKPQEGREELRHSNWNHFRRTKIWACCFCCAYRRDQNTHWQRSLHCICEEGRPMVLTWWCQQHRNRRNFSSFSVTLVPWILLHVRSQRPRQTE